MNDDPDAWVGDAGFVIGFPSDIDLSPFTQCRLVVARPDGTFNPFDFDQAVFQSVDVGGTLNYTVQDGDLTVEGYYRFQVFAKDATRDLALGDPFKLTVGDRLHPNAWSI